MLINFGFYLFFFFLLKVEVLWVAIDVNSFSKHVLVFALLLEFLQHQRKEGSPVHHQ